MFCIVFCIALAISTSLGIEIVYEKAEQFAGFEVFNSTLRVRKYNRTTIVLNGTVSIKGVIDDTFVVYMDMFHSSLGNQQFQHYPMKLPVTGMCQFVETVNEDYPEFIETFINFPKSGVCPLEEVDMHVIDHIFPSKVAPPTLPLGLWKIVFVTKQEDVVRTKIEVMVKAYNDKYF